ncbi:protein inturned [Diprion similis]|uniref:protein inturned n=1 Tax=Diprion similis TaxID=362088 RepID=UPI001EF7F5EB|nr:protein inturned [Diprion similis]
MNEADSKQMRKSERSVTATDQQVVIDINVDNEREDNGDEEEVDEVGGDEEDADEDDWWESDAASSTGSYYSDNDSSIVEWDSAIKWNGEVFYIESLPSTLTDTRDYHSPLRRESKSLSPELTRRRSTRAGKLMRLIRRRESRRCSVRNKKTRDVTGEKGHTLGANEAKFFQRGGTSQGTTKEVTFRDSEAGEIKEVTVRVDPGKRHKLGRRASLCEAYLGIAPGAFSDNVRVMVAGFVPGGEAMKDKNIKIGDWLRSLDGREVNVGNLESLLSEILEPQNVKLELQRVAGSEIGKTPLESNFEKPQSPMVRRLVLEEESHPLMELLLKHSVGITFVKTTGLSETGPELQDVLYTFPRSLDNSTQSILCRARGAFATLDHMLPGISGPRPISTSTWFENELIHISYVSRGEELLLLALPEKFCCLQETLEITEDVVRVLEFSYRTLGECFTPKKNHSSLDHFFALLFWRPSKESTNLASINESKNDLSCSSKASNFHDTLPAARFIQLPRDAQIQIDAALNEMEAMDYRDWNEDPMDCQRLYTILGSCLYHKDFLLGSHLPHQDLIEIHSFLRQKGLLNLIKNEPVKSLIVWKEVYPLSCNRGHLQSDGENDKPFVPNGRWFLLVVGFGNQLLAVLLESGGCTAELENNASPDVFYVEEAQETLKHIQKIGIPTLAEKWIAANTRSGIELTQDGAANKSIPSIAENLFGLVKSNESRSTLPKTNSVVSKKNLEVSSILKRRSLEQSTVSTGSVYSLQTSEDSTSQGTGAVSEASDDVAPILGRRATRERINNTNSRQSDCSDSDMDYDRNESQPSTMDITDIRQNLLSQAEYIVPKKVSAGTEDTLLHYVHLDTLEGVLLSSNVGIDGSLKDSKVLGLFNSAARVIHKLLQRTVRFEKMLNQDTDKSVINKSLIAIKEHGVLFECEGDTYWVVGRSYTSPQPRELYVCYRDSAPQSLIEMAFRLNTN